MTNEEWIEELYILSNEIGKYSQMHERVSQFKRIHPKLKDVECVELAYIELKREYEDNSVLK